MAKLKRIIYYLFCVLIIAIAVGVIAPLLPIPGNYQILSVFSGSMEPAIHTGSVVIAKPADNYKVGNIITFSDNGMSITHRVHEIKQKNGQNIYTTKGDANNGSDNNEVTKENISGKVLFSVPFMGYAINFAQKPLGFIIIIVIPAVIIIYDEIKKIKKEIKKKIDHRKRAKMGKEEKEQEKRHPQITIKRTENLTRTMGDIQKRPPDIGKRR